MDCKINLIQAIVAADVAIACENGHRLQAHSAHLCEADVQRILVDILRRHLPPSLCFEAIAENRSVGVGRMIPDIIVKRCDGSNWGIFELKTLLQGDRLGGSLVSDDLKKLSKYKQKHSNALCCFVLAADKKPLKNGDLDPLSTNPDAFEERNRPVKISEEDGGYFAIPWMSSDSGLSVALYVWRVVAERESKWDASGSYNFKILFES